MPWKRERKMLFLEVRAKVTKEKKPQMFTTRPYFDNREFCCVVCYKPKEEHHDPFILLLRELSRFTLNSQHRTNHFIGIKRFDELSSTLSNKLAPKKPQLHILIVSCEESRILNICGNSGFLFHCQSTKLAFL